MKKSPLLGGLMKLVATNTATVTNSSTTTLSTLTLNVAATDGGIHTGSYTFPRRPPPSICWTGPDSPRLPPLPAASTTPVWFMATATHLRD
jgi:hypothetical protein